MLPNSGRKALDTAPGTWAAAYSAIGTRVDHQRTVREMAFDLLDIEPGEIGEFVVSTWSTAVDLGEPEEVRGERPEPGDQCVDERVFVVDPEQRVARSFAPESRREAGAPDTEQNEPVPCVG